ncbi:hypothetical protein [Polycladidibacter stylochi]|uniref:hypothetical protein n=1 Tax=Polycladidibacter stylochi TaxID=1807766 RepID=UPI000831E8B6|nr:hypothetical protein [Pseudovibrio stylochi]
MSDLTKDANQTAAAFYESQSITTKDQAEKFCERFEVAMADLLEVIEQETQLLKEGKLDCLNNMEPQKAHAIENYMSGIRLAGQNAIALGNLAPDMIGTMKENHGKLKPLLMTNLQVVSTAKSVTDAVIDTVAEAVGSQLKTAGYNSKGTKTSPSKQARGIACNRSL